MELWLLQLYADLLSSSVLWALFIAGDKVLIVNTS